MAILTISELFEKYPLSSMERAPADAWRKPKGMTPALRAHKAAILKALASTTVTAAGAPVTANLAATEPAERECRIGCGHFQPAAGQQEVRL